MIGGRSSPIAKTQDREASAVARNLAQCLASHSGPRPIENKRPTLTARSLQVRSRRPEWSSRRRSHRPRPRACKCPAQAWHIGPRPFDLHVGRQVEASPRLERPDVRHREPLPRGCHHRRAAKDRDRGAARERGEADLVMRGVLERQGDADRAARLFCVVTGRDGRRQRRGRGGRRLDAGAVDPAADASPPDEAGMLIVSR